MKPKLILYKRHHQAKRQLNRRERYRKHSRKKITTFEHLYAPFVAHATIKDIAHKLQISTSTVSRALRDRYDVNPETRRRVMECARELNYLPSLQALGLLTRKTLTLGVVVPEIDNQFFSRAIHGIEDVAFEHDYHILICQTRDNGEREARIIEKLLSQRVDGIIVSLAGGSGDLTHLKRVLQYDVPLVLFDRVSSDIETHKVVNNDYQGALEAVNHLLATGRRCIAHLAGPLHLTNASERYRGYADALRNAKGHVCRELVVPSGFKQELALENTLKLLREHPETDAIFCASDNVAIGALRAARQLGLQVPQQLAIMGFSNLAVSEILDPPLSTVAQPAFEMGQEAARLLLNSMHHEGKPQPPETIQLPTQLIIRASA